MGQAKLEVTKKKTYDKIKSIIAFYKIRKNKAN